MADRPDPAMNADEQTTLSEFLDYYRETLMVKVEGLTDEQARSRSSPPSTLNLLGLVRHLADVERSWFRRGFAGEDDAPPIFYTDDDPELDMQPPPSATLAEAVDAWRAEVDAARHIQAGAAMGDLSLMERHGERVTMRWIVTHMIEEYARHCGHADLLREAIDGQTGD